MADEHIGHGHGHGDATSRTRLMLVLVLTGIIMVAEIVGGILSHSLALLGDAGHMLVDELSLALTLFAIIVAARPATSTKTFGYHRVEIMAALANGILLALVSASIIYEAYGRFVKPPVVNAPLMLVIAAIGLVANIGGMSLLSGVSHHSLNLKAAFWHIIGDTVSSLGVIAAGAIIWVRPEWGIVDPILAIILALVILWGAVRLSRESVDILLEAVPSHLSLDDVIKALQSVPGVDEVHDVHVWTLTSDIHALSAHLMIQDQSVSGSGEIVNKVNKEMRRKFNITHTTLQLECERCATCPIGTVCNITRPEEPEERVERI